MVSRSDERSPACPNSLVLRLPDGPRETGKMVPVRAIAPLPKGALRAAQAALADAHGTPLAADVRPAALWPDGSVKWLVAELCLPLADEERPLRLFPGRPAQVSPRAPVRAGEAGKSLSLVSGTLRVDLCAEGDLPLAGVWVDQNRDRVFEELERALAQPGEGALEVTDDAGRAYRPSGKWALAITEKGALRATVCAEGELCDHAGRAAFRCRLEVCAFLSSLVLLGKITVAPANGGQRATARKLRFALRFATQVNAVRCDDPEDAEGWLDAVLEEGEAFRLEHTAQRKTVVVRSGSSRESIIAEGRFGLPWINAGDPLTSVTFALREGCAEGAAFEVSRRELSVEVPFAGAAVRREVAWVAEFATGEETREIGSSARLLLRLPVLALPSPEDVLCARALDPLYALPLRDGQTGPPLREMLRELKVTDPHPEHFPGALVAGFLLGSERLVRVAVERARRAANLGAELACARWAELGRELLCAASGEQPPLAASRAPLPRLDSLPANAASGLLALAGLSGKEGGEELARAKIAFQRACADARVAELWVLCLPAFLRACAEHGIERAEVDPSLFSLVPVEEPALLSPGESRAIAFVARCALRAVRSVDVFPLPSEGLEAAPFSLSLALSPPGERHAGAESNAVFSVELRLAEGAERATLFVDAQPSAVELDVPRTALAVRAAAEKIAIVGEPPEALALALRQARLAQCRVRWPAEFAPEGFDVVFACGAAPGEGAGLVCNRALQAGAVVVLVNVQPGTWLGQLPATRLVLRAHDERAVVCEEPGAELLNIPQRVARAAALAPGAGAIEAGPAWRTVLRTAGKRLLLGEAELGHGGAIVAQLDLCGPAARPLCENIVERALYLAGL